MNPDPPSREQIEARLTALLLGELPAEEAELLRWTIARDPELQKLHDRLKQTIGFVRETVAHPVEGSVEDPVVRKLSDERRQKLLAHFQTPRPQQSFWVRRMEIPSLGRVRRLKVVPVLVVLAIIALLAAMLLPSLHTAKSKAQRSWDGSGEFDESAYSLSLAGSVANREFAKSAPVTTVAPAPVLAPPSQSMPAPTPAEIVLPKREPAPDTGGVYSANVVGYVNTKDLKGYWSPVGNAGGVNANAGGGGLNGNNQNNGAVASFNLSANSPLQQRAMTGAQQMGNTTTTTGNPEVAMAEGSGNIEGGETAVPGNAGVASANAGGGGGSGGGFGGFGGFAGGGAGHQTQMRATEILPPQETTVFTADNATLHGAERQTLDRATISPPASAANRWEASSVSVSEQVRRMAQSAGATPRVGEKNTSAGAPIVNSGTLTSADNFEAQKESGRDQNVTVIPLNDADPQQVAQVLQKMFGGTSVSRGSSGYGQNSALQQRVQSGTDTASIGTSGGGFRGGGAAANPGIGGGLGNNTYNDNGMVGTANIQVDPVTHNVVIAADKETTEQIRRMVSSLDVPSASLAPPATMPAAKFRNAASGTAQSAGSATATSQSGPVPATEMVKHCVWLVVGLSVCLSVGRYVW